MKEAPTGRKTASAAKPNKMKASAAMRLQGATESER
jgi:hypothetical protein